MCDPFGEFDGHFGHLVPVFYVDDEDFAGDSVDLSYGSGRACAGCNVKLHAVGISGKSDRDTRRRGCQGCSQ